MSRLIRANTMDHVYVRNDQHWSSETCCLKQYTADGKNYQAFGVIVNSTEPVQIYLRGKSEADDYKQVKTYVNFDDMFNDGWVVD